jgi:hypothetical protein
LGSPGYSRAACCTGLLIKQAKGTWWDGWTGRQGRGLLSRSRAAVAVGVVCGKDAWAGAVQG